MCMCHFFRKLCHAVYIHIHTHSLTDSLQVYTFPLPNSRRLPEIPTDVRLVHVLDIIIIIIVIIIFRSII